MVANSNSEKVESNTKKERPSLHIEHDDAVYNYMASLEKASKYTPQQFEIKNHRNTVEWSCVLLVLNINIVTFKKMPNFVHKRSKSNDREWGKTWASLAQLLSSPQPKPSHDITAYLSVYRVNHTTFYASR